jgi:selenocysteine lyase/cysteine desulfurase
MATLEQFEDKIQLRLSENLHGHPIVKTPFGETPLIYADHTASGQLFKKVDKYMNRHVNPYYANTHSNAYAGRMMSKLIETSKMCIRRSMGATQEDAVVFTGFGSSAAITHFAHLLDVFKKRDNADEKPIVLVSDFEHNSNFLPWKSDRIDHEIVRSNAHGLLDLVHLEELLQKYSGRKIKIASLSAGSNITGIVQDVAKISVLSHKYGYVVAYDYAAVGPYVQINMHPGKQDGDHIDAVFISPHKFLGGPGSPGLLVMAKALVTNESPFYPSGGTVRYVSNKKHIWSSDLETRESGGTPNILGSIRCGLAFKLKDRLLPYITSREAHLVPYIRKRLNTIGGVHLLVPNCEDNSDIVQVPIFPIVIPPLHYNLIVVLLNDLFGIQTRGGVSCSGVYAERLLHINETAKRRIEKHILSNKGVPSDYGWCRITFHYTMSWDVIDYILKSVEFVAKYGYLFTSCYSYDARHNLWKHSKAQDDAIAAITDLDFEMVPLHKSIVETLTPHMLENRLRRAKKVARQLRDQQIEPSK